VQRLCHGSRWLKRLHGGSITAANNAPRGARFTLTSPLPSAAGPQVSR
jgi:signal transduction histidine kinase